MITGRMAFGGQRPKRARRAWTRPTPAAAPILSATAPSPPARRRAPLRVGAGTSARASIRQGDRTSIRQGDRTSIWQDDRAVSAVISAVLIFTLFSTAFLLWSINTLPEWVADREHDHALAAAGSLSRLAAELDATPVGEQASISIDLAPRRVPLLQASAASGSLAFEEGFSWNGAYDGERAFMTGGTVVAQPLGLPSESDVASIRALEMVFTGPGGGGGSVPSTYIEVTAFVDEDGDGTVDAGEPSVQIRLGLRPGTACASVEAFVETGSGTGSEPPIVATHIVACDASSGASLSIDAMQSQYRFAGLLGRLGDDFSVTSRIVPTGSGDAAMMWRDAAGKTHVSGTGLDMDLDSGFQGGRIALQANYQEFVARTVALEGGGVLNIEDGGAAFVQEPVFVLGKDGSNGFLRWRIMDMSGSGALAGQDSATIRATKVATSETILQADSAQFTLETEAPSAWSQLWNDAWLIGGLDAGDVAVSTTEQTATLNLDPLLTWTIHLTIIHVEVAIT